MLLSSLTALCRSFPVHSGGVLWPVCFVCVHCGGVFRALWGCTVATVLCLCMRSLYRTVAGYCSNCALLTGWRRWSCPSWLAARIALRRPLEVRGLPVRAEGDHSAAPAHRQPLPLLRRHRCLPPRRRLQSMLSPEGPAVSACGAAVICCIAAV